MKKKTDVMSIRIDQDIKKKLIEESEFKNLTLNSLISQIVSKHVERGSLYSDVGFISLGKSSFKELIDEISDSAIKKIASTIGKETFKETSIYLYGEFTPKSIIFTMDSWFDISHIPFRRIEKEDFTRFVIRHDLGKKWTLFFETMLKSIFDELKISPKNFVKTTFSISFQL